MNSAKICHPRDRRARRRGWIAAGAAVMAMLFAGAPALAGGGHHHGYGRHHGGYHGGHHVRAYHHPRPRYYGHHRGYHDGYVALGILSGVAVAGALLAPPRYVAPAPVYYAPPARQCYQEDVYRYLPDGRIQWGVKTTCY